MDFVCRENLDGSFEVYNTKIGDIYFSNVGAYKEALEKFVIPSLPVIKNKTDIKILDVCFGMGYNSKTFFDYTLKNNQNINCEIDAIDIDKNILALGLLIFDKNISSETNLIFGKYLMDSMCLEENIEKISKEDWVGVIFNKFKANYNEFLGKNGIDLYQVNNLSVFLHNIYYQNQLKSEENLKFNMILGNLLQILPKLSNEYDLIFHDAFSIRQQPELWSEYVMNNYFRLLSSGGRLLTYSNSRVLRRTMEKVGFIVEINYDENNKMNGTIGIKK